MKKLHESVGNGSIIAKGKLHDNQECGDKYPGKKLGSDWGWKKTTPNFRENPIKGLKIGKNGVEGAVVAKFWDILGEHLGKKINLGGTLSGKEIREFRRIYTPDKERQKLQLLLPPPHNLDLSRIGSNQYTKSSFMLLLTSWDRLPQKFLFEQMQLETFSFIFVIIVSLSLGLYCYFNGMLKSKPKLKRHQCFNFFTP